MKTKQNMKNRVLAGLLTLCLLWGLLPSAALAAEGTADNAIKNASFEEPVINSQWAQPDEGTVPAWSTTAAGNKIELVSTRINGKVPHINNGTTVEVLPDGNQFAELNADE